MEQYGKIIKILHWRPFEGWPNTANRARPSKPICQKGWDGCAQLGQPWKGHLCRIFNYFSIMFYYIISTTYQKIGDLFCPVICLDFRTVCTVTRIFPIDQWGLLYSNHYHDPITLLVELISVSLISLLSTLFSLNLTVF